MRFFITKNQWIIYIIFHLKDFQGIFLGGGDSLNHPPRSLIIPSGFVDHHFPPKKNAISATISATKIPIESLWWDKAAHLSSNLAGFVTVFCIPKTRIRGQNLGQATQIMGSLNFSGC